jgi:hypothetical protein
MKKKLIAVIIGIMIVFVISILGFTYLKLIEPEWLLTIVNGILTTSLVIISALHMVEARRMRLESAKPIFSIQPADFYGESFLTLHILNSGGTAKDVRIDVSYKNHTEQFYNSSIGTGERVPILHLMKEPYFPNAGGVVAVQVKCKDSYGVEHLNKLTIDFDSLVKENRAVTNVLSPLDIIARHLKDIAWRLDDIEREIRHH